jgi:Bifunctional DNA primase/polymerase, N-terminal
MASVAIAAREFAQRGFKVLPLFEPDPTSPTGCSCFDPKCESPGKHPRVKLSAATTSQKVIEGWFNRWLGAGVAIMLDGSVDIAPDSVEALEDFTARGLPGGAAVWQSGSGEGHVHNLYRAPLGCPAYRLCRSGEFDILSVGYAVVPPSNNAKGPYVWIERLPANVEELPEAPVWAVQMLRDSAGRGAPDEHQAPPGEPPVYLTPARREWWDGERQSRGADGTIDRSRTLFNIGLVLAGAGLMSTELIADALRERDETLGYRKYADRRDAGTRAYQDIAEKALSRAQEEREAFQGAGEHQAPDNKQQREPDWPSPPGAAAFFGLPGRIVRAWEPHTEGDSAAILLQLLVAFSNACGRGPYVQIGATRHHLNLFAVIAGETSKARKGDSWTPPLATFEMALPDWSRSHIASGLYSGEGLIWAVRDPIEKTERVSRRGEEPRYENVITDQGVSDKRLLVVESEFAQCLSVMDRPGNTLSPVVRAAWDNGNLRSLVKNSPARASGAHISIVGHITIEELRLRLLEVEAANGFANRYLFAVARRSKLLPRPQALDFRMLQALGTEVRDTVSWASQQGEIGLDAEAVTIWDKAYAELSSPKTGLLGKVLARGEAQVRRLAADYALFDRQTLVGRDHLLAAAELWDFCERSSAFIFGDRSGDRVEDTILDALRERPMTRNEIMDLFQRNESSARIAAVLASLMAKGRVRSSKEQTAGRPVEWWEFLK